MVTFVRRVRRPPSATEPAGDAAVVEEEGAADEADEADAVDALPEEEGEEGAPTNAELHARELRERDAALAAGPDDGEFGFLYPTLDDPNFALNLARRKEFFDAQYDGEVRDVKAHADAVCRAEFELMPHQMFVRNFMSAQTPYNSLYMYHELGTGKTCSAIGVAEEMRAYTKNVGARLRVIVVAGPNVQDNFRLQLFNERLLREDAGVWNIQACVGNSLLREINPTNIKGLSRAQVVDKIGRLIKKHYAFKGYMEFANSIKAITALDETLSARENKAAMIKRVRESYNGHLVIIDEVHNATSLGEKYKLTSTHLLEVVRHTETMRLLLLSATPMYNSYKEIVWTVNLLNLNDGRAQIKVADVFDKDGFFVEPAAGEEGGLALLRRKLVGYMSYVRGENPYSFPFRVYPPQFAPERTFAGGAGAVPTAQFNGKPVEQPLKLVHVYLTAAGAYQEAGYTAVVRGMRARNESGLADDDSMDSKLLAIPLQALNMVYPSAELDRVLAGSAEPADSRRLAERMVGEVGLAGIMDHTDDRHRNPPARYDFEYTQDTLGRYGRVFQLDTLRKYSGKISNICDCVLASTGIVLIYAQYIDGGVVPMALALEELGLARYCAAGGRPLLSAAQSRGVEQRDARTMRPRAADARDFVPARYAMITGNASFSPNNALDLKRITGADNARGEKVKVVIISKAGAEGLDFKNVRQIHAMDAWYNMSRVQQIIGRGVRNLSHCALPFEERNVEIYLYTTLLAGAPAEESADLYVYRMAERKAVQIGRVTRVLKESAVDCVLNIKQTNFTIDKINALAANQNVRLRIASGKTIDYRIGDKPFSEACDYMAECAFECAPRAAVSPDDVRLHSYSEEFVRVNDEAIMQRVRSLFKDRHVYTRASLVAGINVARQYPIAQIYSALSRLVDSEATPLVDKYGRLGYLANAGQYYTFRPAEITDPRSSVYDRSAPVDYKREKVVLVADKSRPQTKHAQNPDEAAGAAHSRETFRAVMADVECNVRGALGDERPRTPQSRWSWYAHAGTVLRHIEAVHGIPRALLEKYVVHHAVDTMHCRAKLALVSEMYRDAWRPATDIEREIKSYLDATSIMRVGGRLGILMINSANNNILYLRAAEDGAPWAEAEPVDSSINARGTYRYFGDQLQASFKLHPAKIRQQTYIGFFSFFEVSSDIVFKVKNMADMGRRKCHGARIDQAGKPKTIKILNDIAHRTLYTDETVATISGPGLGIVLELLMRYMTVHTVGGGSLMFLGSEAAYFNRELLGI